uniref:Uncharacterized protein n=1 Tax=Romanomermis culicivorax TaxID=13658 RepID=A0A915KJV2_ROMCU
MRVHPTAINIVAVQNLFVTDNVVYLLKAAHNSTIDSLYSTPDEFAIPYQTSTLTPRTSSQMYQWKNPSSG